MCWPRLEGEIETEERRRQYEYREAARASRRRGRRFVKSQGEEAVHDEWMLIHPNPTNYNPYERPRYDHSRKYMQSAAPDALFEEPSTAIDDTLETTQNPEAIDDTLETTQNQEAIETADVTEDWSAPRKKNTVVSLMSLKCSVFSAS